MSRKEAKAETRQSLLIAARRVFAQAGIRDAKIADIVRAAGVAQGTFYVHFRTKSDVVDQLVRRFNREHGARMVELATRHLRAGSRAVIAAQARAHIGLWRDNADLLPILVDHVARHAEREPLLLRDVSDSIAAFAEEVTRGGGVTLNASPREIARIVVTLWRQSGFHAARDRETPPEDAARTLTLCTVAIYDALAPGLTEISPRALAAAYRRIVRAAQAQATAPSG